MGLNQTSRKALAFNEKTVKQFPKLKNELDWILFEFNEMLEDLIYEDKKENNNRHPLYERNVKIHSLLLSMKKIADYKNPQDVEKIFSEFINIQVRIEQIEYRVKIFKKNVNKVISKLNKDFFDE